MAKGGKLTQKDLMIWTMNHPNGTKTYYLLEKEPFQKEGVKKAVHLPGSTRDAVFAYLDQAEEVMTRFPPGEEAEGGGAEGQEAGATASEAE